MTRVGGDRGDIVLGWLTRVTIILGLLGLVGFDAVSVLQGHFQAADRATTAASTAADTYRSTHDLQKAFNDAYATIGGGDTIEPATFAVAADGTVTLRLHHLATTLLLYRIAPLKHWAEAVETGAGRPPS